jgi:hypothetical protein
MADRYIISTIRANIGDGPRYELLDTKTDGGEGEPLIEARFYDRDVADKAAAALNRTDRRGGEDYYQELCHDLNENVSRDVMESMRKRGGDTSYTYHFGSKRFEEIILKHLK